MSVPYILYACSRLLKMLVTRPLVPRKLINIPPNSTNLANRSINILLAEASKLVTLNRFTNIIIYGDLNYPAHSFTFMNNLKRIFWESSFENKDVDYCYEIFLNVYSNLFSSLILKRDYSKKKTKNYYLAPTKKLIRYKKNLWYKYISSYNNDSVSRLYKAFLMKKIARIKFDNT
ncbi:hypothetical protein BpHYR1_017823 [Brachionus plicatilis]|uniref:Uncharacterized protein n=1 Tax=Brachionus plicatilis TaxID=10195 RepID=A0A3M7RM88_BRAPC|nr:hypothetical protein BpHYR1_017823 [Brachionus plicatilis]